MALEDAHFKADQALVNLLGEVHILEHVKPTNADDERVKFLNSAMGNPDFRYRDPDYDTERLGQALEAIEIPDDDVGQLLEGVRGVLRARNIIVANLGNPEIVQAASESIYGRPTPELVQRADQIIKRTVRKQEDGLKSVSANDLVTRFRKRLESIGLTEWDAMTSDRALVVTANSARQQIRIPSDYKCTERRANGLEAHEIGAHAIRGENGRLQLLKVLGQGSSGYMATEEGLALHFQDLTDTFETDNMLAYAGRVIAVDSVYQSLDFRQTYDRLMSYNKFTPLQAYQLTLRAHRGGGFLKDGIYLDGYEQVKAFVAGGGDVRELMVGKIGIAQLPIIRRLREQGIIEAPRYLPWFLEGTSV